MNPYKKTKTKIDLIISFIIDYICWIVNVILWYATQSEILKLLIIFFLASIIMTTIMLWFVYKTPTKNDISKEK